MVPPIHMHMLYGKAAARNNRCTFANFPTGTHMDTWIAGGDPYWQKIQTFLQQNVLKRKDDVSLSNTNGMSLFPNNLQILL